MAYFTIIVAESYAGILAANLSTVQFRPLSSSRAFEALLERFGLLCEDPITTGSLPQAAW